MAISLSPNRKGLSITLAEYNIILLIQMNCNNMIKVELNNNVP